MEQICPVCKTATPHTCGSWHQCIQYTTPVCEKCCNSCKYHKLLLGYMFRCQLLKLKEEQKKDRPRGRESY